MWSIFSDWQIVYVHKPGSSNTSIAQNEKPMAQVNHVTVLYLVGFVAISIVCINWKKYTFVYVNMICKKKGKIQLLRQNKNRNIKENAKRKNRKLSRDPVCDIGVYLKYQERLKLDITYHSTSHISTSYKSYWRDITLQTKHEDDHKVQNSL